MFSDRRSEVGSTEIPLDIFLRLHSLTSGCSCGESDFMLAYLDMKIPTTHVSPEITMRWRGNDQMINVTGSRHNTVCFSSKSQVLIPR